jgi:large subunit ribosomal protein L13
MWQVLGRLASQIAVVLQGKHKGKPTYAPLVENGDMCIVKFVFNAKDISVTGRKRTDKFTTDTQG